MVSGTPCWSLSSMAVAPSSWKYTGFQTGESWARAPPAPSAHLQPYHHVVLHLLVHAGQPVLPAVPGQAGLEPSLGPLPIVLFVQILVGQNQGPQPLPGVFLGTEPRSASALPAMTLSSEPQGHCPHTYIQVVGGGAEQPPGAGVKPLQQDRVGPFAVQSDPPFWISHWGQAKGRKSQEDSGRPRPPTYHISKSHPAPPPPQALTRP